MSPSADSSLADMTRGFHDVVHGAQQTYRVLLTAMSRPGLVLRLPDAAIEGMTPPHSIGIGMAATLLALLDAETAVALTGGCHSSAAEAWLRFHSGARLAGGCGEAAFVAARGGALDVADWSRLALGTDEAPQLGATLILEVDALFACPDADADAARLTLRGPGIDGETRLAVGGPSRAFWEWRVDLQRRMPRGVDLILACDDRLAAVPRSTRVIVHGGRH